MKKITNFLGAMLLLSLLTFVSSDLSAQDCEGFQVAPAAICSPDDEDFNVLLVFDGADAVTVTDNATGGSITTAANSITFGPIMSGTGYSFTVAPEGGAAGEGCVVVVNQTVVDCNVTAVELLRWTGSVETLGNVLEWTTATETDVKSFIVEYSANGFDFEKIGSVVAAGNSNTTEQYSLTHNDVKSGVHYYRLLEETTNGQTNVVSDVIGLDRGAAEIQITEISPVPAVDFVNVKFEAQANQEVTIEVVDITGRVLSSKVSNANEGTTIEQMDVATLAVGTYFITVSDGTQTLMGKFVKN